MMVANGTKLGRYEIRSKLGAGGMGEVYRARDEKLNRDVAIKVLPSALSQDADRLRRFEQEAQAAGALNHPNILAVYDVGTHDGSPYIVSELLEGEELREQLNDGSLPKRNAWLAWIVAGVLLMAALILAIPYFFQRAEVAPAVTRFIITPPEKLIIGESVALSPDGKLLAFSGTDEKGKTLLWIRALDTLTLQPVPDTEGGRFPFWSLDGRSLGFFAGSKLKKIEISGGSAQTLADTSIVGAQDAVAPDVQRVALNGDTRDLGDVWILGLAQGTFTRFTFDPNTDRGAVWSPDGSRVVFTSNRNGRDHLYQRLATGGGGDELLLPDPGVTADDWSKDGRFLLCEANRAGTNVDLWILPMTGDRKPLVFLQTESDETHAQFSPDGWIVYVSNESGRPEVYVQSFPSSGGKWQVSVGYGDQPQWRRDGKEIFYMGPDRKLMVVSVTAGTSFQAGAPAALFQTRVETSSSTSARNNYVVAADGQRFLVNNVVLDSASQPITVVLNWTAQLKK